MPEEVLRYRVEIDEASLQSELARARGAITNVLQTAITTGQYAVNQLSADVALTRQTFGIPEPVAASPSQDLGFFGASLGVAGIRTPPNMLTSDFRAAAQQELQSRISQGTFAIAREAIPVAAGLGAVGLGMAGRARPLTTLAAGAATFMGARGATGLGLGTMEARQSAEEILSLTGAPHPMLQFSREDREGLARGLVQDVAQDVRFGVEEVGGLLAMGSASDAFTGVRSVEEFRTRFRAMLDQVRTITRVFQQTTQEAMQTLGEFNRLGVASPEVMTGRLADVRSLTQATGMAPGQILQTGMAGAQMAEGMGAAPGAGFDVMMRNMLRAQTAGATMAIDPNVMQRLGGFQGVAAEMTQFGFQAAQAPAMRSLIAGLSNDTMTGLDQARLRQFVQGQVSFEDIQQQALNRMSDPAMQTRFAANSDILQQQLAASGLAGPALFRMAEVRGEFMGVPGADVFGVMMRQMGLDPAQRQAIGPMVSGAAQFDFVAARRRELAELEIQMERQREESRFTSRVGASFEQFQVGVGNFVGDPIRAAGRAAGGFFQNVVALPSRAAEWLDISLGKAVFGAPGMSEGLTQRQMSASQMKAATDALQTSVRAVTNRVNFGTLKMWDRLSFDEFTQFEEVAVAEFGGEISDLIAESDGAKRGEMREKLKEKMSGWFHTNFGHLSEGDAAEAKAFTDKMLQIETVAGRNSAVLHGIESVKKNASALQMRIFVGDEIPSILAASVAKPSDVERVTGIGTQMAAAFQGGGEKASLQALRTLGEKAIPLLSRGAPIRERLEITDLAFRRGFLTPGDMQLSTKELGAIADQNLTAEQARFVGALRRQADEAEGKEISAEKVFKTVGQGLGGQFPSRTPGPGTNVSPYAWDQTTQVLDRLNGSVQNLNAASRELLKSITDQNKKTAGKS